MTSLRSMFLGAAAVTACACTQEPSPPVISAQVGSVAMLTAGGGFLYWAEADTPGAQTLSIQRLAESGGTPQLVVSGVQPTKGLATDGEHVYWIDGLADSLLAAPVAGLAAGAAPTTIASDLANPEGLVVVGRDAYVLQYPGIANFFITRFGLDDRSQSKVAYGELLGPIATDGTALYFAQASLQDNIITSSIMRYAAGDAAPAPVFSAQNIVRALAVGGGTVVVAADKDSPPASAELAAAPLSGGASVDLGAVDIHILDVAVVSGSVYWTASDGIWSAPGAGGHATQVSGGLGLLLASDGERVFADVEHNASEEIVVANP
jgi:hypothetical protein